VRFLAAFLILCFAGVFGNVVISVGWATFLIGRLGNISHAVEAVRFD